MNLLDDDIEGVEEPDYDVKELIIRRRKQVMVHSYIYYRLGTNVVSDAQFDKWCNQLVQLHRDHGTEFDFYDKYFRDWRGETGMHFPFEPWVYHKAEMVLREHERQTT